SEIDEIFHDIIKIRRTLHSYPELSFQEFKTTELIQNYLEGIGIKTFRPTETGVVALLGDLSRENCIAFRADIDALPIEEQTNLPFASKNNGIMHACGHDFHTSILLGTAKILKKFENHLQVNIKLIFQPGEEKLPGGALKLIQSGILENPNVSAIFAEHIDPETEVGHISISGGTIMASADELYWTIRGKGCHAAQPHLGNDTIRAATALLDSLYRLSDRIRDPLEPLLLAVTSINGGNATNVYPSIVKLAGTLRTFNDDIRKSALENINKICKFISGAYDLDVDFNPILGYPPLKNDILLSNYIKKLASELFGNTKVLDFKPKLWAEDFAFYSQKVPSVFWFLGTKPKGYVGEIFGLHSSKLNPDELAIKFGIALFVKIALTYQNFK
ncbi:MAG: M20 family metallopeptidase, partial [Candidatus Kapaibacteriota bacterium]